MTHSTMKPLTTAQYDTCKQRALERVAQRIGERPARKQYEREYGRNWTILDALAMIIFVAALIVSSVHIIEHMGLILESVVVREGGGINIGGSGAIVIHQLSYIALAEAAMLLFLTMWALQGRGEKGLRKYASIPLTLAVIAAVFVVIANWQSGIGLLESLMPPIFTIGVGLHLERKIVESLKRREAVDERYLQALHLWEQGAHDPAGHPDYLPLLKQEIWQKLVSLKDNVRYRESSAAFKSAAVRPRDRP